MRERKGSSGNREDASKKKVCKAEGALRLAVVRAKGDVHCELFKRRKLSERVKKSRKIRTQLGIEPRTF